MLINFIYKKILVQFVPSNVYPITHVKHCEELHVKQVELQTKKLFYLYLPKQVFPLK